jgi:hypothetical protein
MPYKERKYESILWRNEKENLLLKTETNNRSEYYIIQGLFWLDAGLLDEGSVDLTLFFKFSNSCSRVLV